MGDRFQETLKRTAKSLMGKVLFGPGFHRTLLRQTAAVVEFHRVNDNTSPGAMDCSSDQFIEYCRFFRGHFSVVPLREVVTKLEQGLPLSGELAITFDDGYRDNAAVAAPILKRMGLHATFFVVSGFIGTDTTPQWDAASGGAHPWMTGNDLIALQDQGFDIGSHSHTHPNFGSISRDQARNELTLSRSRLEAILGRPVDLFAYPFGDRSHMSSDALEVVRETGYRCCLSGFGGINVSGCSPFLLKRFPISTWYASPFHLAGDMITHAVKNRRPSRPERRPIA